MTDTSPPLRIEEFEYDLPEELIAQEPLSVRHKSRLLYLNKHTGAIQHLHFENIVEILSPGDLLVVNNTKVIPARLIASRASGGTVKILLLKANADNPGIWEALVTPIKRLKPGEQLTVQPGGPETASTITVKDIITGPDGFKRLVVDLGTRSDVFALLTRIGVAPLPPYIRRDHEELSSLRQTDMSRYQTVYATAPGAVAAPTAGLHFSDETLKNLANKGISVEHITLHVGPGTFKPIAESVDEHTIEAEQFAIPNTVAEKINGAKKDGRRIVGVGTTTLRALESAAKDNRVQPVENGSTSLYVKPGYQFQIIDGLVTNFHLSRSSLLVLVSAFAGRDKIMRAYQEAIEQRYRFFSYGDAMLIL